MHRAAQRGVAGEIDIDAGQRAVERPHVVVQQHLVVAAERAREFGVGGRGEPNDAQPVRAPRKAERGTEGGLARRAGQQHAPGSEEPVFLQKIVDEKRGDEQRPQHRLLTFLRGVVAWVCIAEDELVVHGSQAFAMSCRIGEPVRAHTRGLHHEVRAHRQVTVDAPAHRDTVCSRLGHGGKAPNRDAAPGGVLGGKKLPVLHRLTKGGIGDVVGSQGEVSHLQARLAVGERSGGGRVEVGCDANRAKVSARNEETRTGVEDHGQPAKQRGLCMMTPGRRSCHPRSAETRRR